jgi:hypothetical protein
MEANEAGLSSSRHGRLDYGSGRDAAHEIRTKQRHT